MKKVYALIQKNNDDIVRILGVFTNSDHNNLLIDDLIEDYSRATHNDINSHLQVIEWKMLDNSCHQLVH